MTSADPQPRPAARASSVSPAVIVSLLLALPSYYVWSEVAWGEVAWWLCRSFLEICLLFLY